VDGETVGVKGEDMTTPALHRIMPKEAVVGGRSSQSDAVQQRQSNVAADIAAGKPGASWAVPTGGER
jgi:hypothetical protein